MERLQQQPQAVSNSFLCMSIAIQVETITSAFTVQYGLSASFASAKSFKLYNLSKGMLNLIYVTNVFILLVLRCIFSLYENIAQDIFLIK